ncbi:MBL fold metallo-hydrolase [Selenihalanaerobacter shriftii]|uniref:Glyoxylase, beta-lactamase superfamily II n=1 Tax=Selenihalanaerobacter shriftii TaxID=142842 RepID=A0A1T4N095_9FIRM|nr:MBL fold metallo-hydrolase [Selenihalanaerobacter shriftii]SJZ72534.1 Glyoxylase, beta-lactamase superfamily II [Selenihalanaerobacter shriftii]
MILKELGVGQLDTNCYILGDEETGQAIVIDPGAEGKRILSILDKNDLKIKYIVNTHGHHDHIGANGFLLENNDAELFIHSADAEYLTNSKYNLSFYHKSTPIEGPEADRLLSEGDQIKCGEWNLKVIHTPGHTPGGILLKGNGKLFSGDTIFTMGIGRTDLPNASTEQIKKSIQEKILTIEENLEVYPGHGPHGMLEEIKSVNPYL